MMKKNFKVWECKIVVPGDAELPEGFDSPPRRAAIEAIETEGIEVLSCFSCWGGELSAAERKIVEREHARETLTLD